ncbi:hypothetical protein SAMN05444422_103407 [Halobiforma haloterrestris]|uniref:Uncharacterized protein n=1 Tax=Natronobacterium haloterrestre TaxID=148448 RepID=A0A1I1FR42_NATHA|nr:hypothetical protein [Halobiforma haloterrestris]SFB99460.1 hypothetical protein SAMN05444422_103407 [Halobiforma haloterrestris]
MPSTFGSTSPSQSPSRSRSRRRLLAAAGGCLATVFAGCAGDGSESTTESSASEGPPDGGFDSTHEYESLFVRADDPDPFVYRSEDEAEDAQDDETVAHRLSRLFVVDESAAADLWIEPGLADEDESEIRDFLEATDFESQSVVVHQRTIEDCYERRLLGIEARDDEYRARFCQTLKAPMTPCEADRELMEAILVRIDRSYAERPSTSGGSEHMSCPDSTTPDAGESDGSESDRGGGTDTDGNDSSTGSSETTDGGEDE